MRRWLLTLAALILIVAGLGWLWWLNPPKAMAARFQPSQCQRIDVIAPGPPAQQTRLVSGIEDIERLDRNTLILSAHDRLDPAQPNGGIYRLELDAMTDGQVRVSHFVPPAHLPEDLRPHGIALSPDKTRLAVINRQRDGRVFLDMIQGIATEAPSLERRDETAFCRANDVFLPAAAEPMLAAVTLDRGSCGTALSDLLGLSPTGRIALVPNDPAAPLRFSAPLHFANGIAAGWVAETRAERLTELSLEWLPQEPRSHIALPGAPDNLTLGKEGRLTVALHPSLLRLALYRFGWADRAPSRIARIDPEMRKVEILFDDPTGTLFSAATVGMLAGGRLIAGSVRDGGLLICEGA